MTFKSGRFLKYLEFLPKLLITITWKKFSKANALRTTLFTNEIF